MRNERTTVYHSFPTALRYFLNSLPDSEVLADLRLVELEGEPVYRNDVELFARHVSRDCVLVNTLSSAETGTVSMFFVEPKTPLTSEKVPVGYSMEGIDVLILDDDGNPLRHEQVGEVAVRSNSLCAGYWSNPAVTRQKFIGQLNDPSTYLYRTNDFGRVSSDGCLHLFGRKDFQVKIRSFRVDVTEVVGGRVNDNDHKQKRLAHKNSPIS